MQPTLLAPPASETGGETTPVDALIHLESTLASLDREDDTRSVELPVAEARQIGVLLLDYLRTLEQLSAAMRMLPFREREAATLAYQSVSQRTARLARHIQASMERLQ